MNFMVTIAECIGSLASLVTLGLSYRVSNKQASRSHSTETFATVHVCLLPHLDIFLEMWVDFRCEKCQNICFQNGWSFLHGCMHWSWPCMQFYEMQNSFVSSQMLDAHRSQLCAGKKMNVLSDKNLQVLVCRDSWTNLLFMAMCPKCPGKCQGRRHTMRGIPMYAVLHADMRLQNQESSRWCIQTLWVIMACLCGFQWL